MLPACVPWAVRSGELSRAVELRLPADRGDPPTPGRTERLGGRRGAAPPIRRLVPGRGRDEDAQLGPGTWRTRRARLGDDGDAYRS
jgi:hypothetical protein